MANQVKIRRGTSAQVAAMTPVSSEVVHDTTNNRLHVGNGSTAGGIILPNRTDVQNNSFTYVSAGGTANAITAAYTPAPSAYAAGQMFAFKASASNTGATTINVNSLGAKNILKMAGGSLSALESGDIINGGIYEVAYDGTQFQLLGVAPAVTDTSGMVLLEVQTASSSAQLDFTTSIDAAYDAFKLVVRGIRGASNAILYLRMSTTASGSFYSGASDYAAAYSSVANTTRTDTASANATHIALSNTITAISSNGFCSDILINAKNNRYPSATWHGGWGLVDGSSLNRTEGYGVLKASSSQLDGLRLIMSTGNISEGQAYLYGLKSSL
jgi:hypothetical protein